MSLRVQVKLVNKSNQAQANVELAVGFYRSSATGSISYRKTGRTASNGTATLVLSDSLGTYLPRIVLKMRKSGRWVTLSDNPETYNSSLANFGTLEITTSALQVNASLAVFALNNSVSSTLNRQISLLQSDKSSLTSQVSKLTRDKSSLNASISRLQKDKQSLSTSISQLNREKSALSSSNSSLSRQVSSLTSEKNTLSGRVSSLTRDKSALVANLSAANEEVDELRATGRSLEQRVSVLNSAKLNVERNLNSIRAQLNHEKKLSSRLNSENTQLQSTLEEKNTEIEQINQQLAEKNPDELPIADVFDNTAKEFESAQEKLKQRKSQFRLGKISMQIKGVPGKTANTLKMLDKDNAEGITPDSLSVYNIEFDAKQETESAAPSQVLVPTLDGYTRRIAERKLAAAGLSPLWLEEHLGRGETAEAHHGRVIRQDPPGQSYVDHGSDVYVTLGKAVLSSSKAGESVDV